MSETKLYRWSSAGFDLVSPGPGSVDAYNKAAATADNPEPCLSDAVDNCIYRGHIPSFWEEVLPKVEKQTGITRGVDADATAKARARSKTPDKVKDVPEKFGKYINRVLASLDDENKKSLTAFILDAAKNYPIDVSPGQRASGPGAANLSKADDVLLRDNAALEQTVAKLMSVVGEFDLERDDDGRPTRESLAFLIKQYTAIVAAV